MHTRFGHVIHVQKFAPRRTGAPYRHHGPGRDFGLMKTPEQSRYHVAMLRVIVIARPVQIGGHDAAIIDAVTDTILPVVTFAQLDAGDFCNGIGFIGRFERASE